MEIEENDNFVFLLVQVMKQSYGYLRDGEQAGAALIKINKSNNVHTVVKSYSDITIAARSLKRIGNFVYFFEGSHYAYYPQTQFRSNDLTIPSRVTTEETPADRNRKTFTAAATVDRSSEEWKNQIGGFYRINSTGVLQELVETGWRSATTEDNPDHDDEKPDYFYGIHGGTSSPILDVEGVPYMITGYDFIDNSLLSTGTTEDADTAIQHSENYNLIHYSNKLSHKVPLLLTNERSPSDVLKEMLTTTNSIMGFDNDRFFIRPREPRKALVGSSGISPSNIMSIDIQPGSQNWIPSNYPNSGLILIGKELISYGDTSEGYSYNAETQGASLTGGITRGLEVTNALNHSHEDDILWVDHFISLNHATLQQPIQSLNLVSQSEHIYNYIEVSYGDDDKAIAKDENSIEINRKQPFELTVPLDKHQSVWAQWIADSFLERFKDLHSIINLTLATTLFLKPGDTVVVHQEDRSYTDLVACQVLEVVQDPAAQTTKVKLVTL